MYTNHVYVRSFYTHTHTAAASRIPDPAPLASSQQHISTTPAFTGAQVKVFEPSARKTQHQTQAVAHSIGENRDRTTTHERASAPMPLGRHGNAWTFRVVSTWQIQEPIALAHREG